MAPGQAPASFQIRQWEEFLFESVVDSSFWIPVNEARELLRREILGINDLRLERGEDSPLVIAELGPLQAHQVAAIQLAGVCSRAAGSVVALVSCGYVPEAKAAFRRLLEAALRARAVIDDESGQHARSWLSGRPLKSLAYLESRYLKTPVMRELSAIAHADSAGLGSLIRDDAPKPWMNFAPQRDDAAVNCLFRLVSIGILMMIMVLVKAHVDYVPSIENVHDFLDLQAKLYAESDFEF